MKKKGWLSVVALVLVLCCAVGGTLAWLTAKTDPVENEFTVGDIDITLAESKNLDLKMVPGRELYKDPKVTVKAGSEACWLFVKVEKSANFDEFLTYTMADGWEQLADVDDVFWREVDAAETDTVFQVLADDKVMVRSTVTKAMLQGVKEKTKRPTLTFTAYAVQKDGFADAAAAWDEVPNA